MKEVLDILGAYEHASAVGLPEIVLHINKEQSRKTIKDISEHYKKEKDFNSYARVFTDILSIFK